jgi:hypothetical protein
MDDDEESNTSSTATDNILSGLNGGTTGGRSVSNTVHDRSRLTNTSAPSVNGGSSTTRRLPHSHHSQTTRNSASSTSPQNHHHHNSSRRNDGDRISSAPSSTSTAKESFLNYFFGQNGPGPVAGANITNMSSEVHGHLNRVGGAVGRDISGPDPNAFMRTRNGPVGDGSDAAFDMKSLGKHIEAVSSNFYFRSFGWDGFWTSGPALCGSLYPFTRSPMSCDGPPGRIGANLQGPLNSSLPPLLPSSWTLRSVIYPATFMGRYFITGP